VTEKPPKYLPAVPVSPLRQGVVRRGRNNVRPDAPEWPAWVEEALFVRWLDEGHNMPRALARLEAEWEDFAELEYDPETGDVTPATYRPVPKATADGWKRRHNWDLRMAEETAKRFPQLDFIHNARLIIARDLGLRRAIEVLQDPNARHADLAAFTKLVMESGGSGTWGNTMRNAPVVREQVNREVDFTAMSEEQLAELQLQLNREGKTRLPERRS
jgi:hypothetical protein